MQRRDLKRMSLTLSGGFTGWHLYSFPEAECADDECATTNPHPNNYFLCKTCTQVAWFKSKIKTFQSGEAIYSPAPFRAYAVCRVFANPAAPPPADDINRAEARKRIQLATPLPVHREMARVHHEFKARGGTIKVFSGKVTLLWSEDGTLIRQALLHNV